MKRYITILVALAALHGVAEAQSVGAGVKVDLWEFDYQADSVRVNLEFNFSDLEIAANQSVVFVPKIFKGERSVELPTVVVRGRGGARSYQRALTLGNSQSLEDYNEWYGTPYQIVENYGEQKQQSLEYALALPYERWMVESELEIESLLCGCCTSEDSGSLMPQNSRLYIDIPTVESFSVRPQVELIKPEKVAIKRRDIAYSSALVFKVNSTYIDPNLEGNKAELASIDEMMQSVISDVDYTITAVNIIGYASPEGLLETNMRLSEGRASALESLMRREYKSIDPALYSVRFGGENWDKLHEILSQSDIDGRDEVLALIENVPVEQGRESKLMALNGGTTYRYLLKNIFPATRLVVVDVQYNVDAYDLVRISELIDTKPQNLSLEEMYRLSETYEVEDKAFEKIFLTAVEVYPDDQVAQNNALVTEIRRGERGSIGEIAKKVDRNTESAELANSLGAYLLLMGEYDQAETMLYRAKELGCPRAEYNLDQLKRKRENIRLMEESEAFRVKIYGE